jgi:hypothetical protein
VAAGHAGHWQLHRGVQLGQRAGGGGIEVEGRLPGESVRHLVREVKLEHGNGEVR